MEAVTDVGQAISTTLYFQDLLASDISLGCRKSVPTEQFHEIGGIHGSADRDEKCSYGNNVFS